MTEAEALKIVEKALSVHLSDIQNVVFGQCWQGKTYVEIANNSGYDSEYIKQIGFHLWQQLTKALSTKVNKNNICSVMQRHLPSQTVVTLEPTTTITVLATQLEAVTPISYKTIIHPGWIAALDEGSFYGRETESNTLTQWIVRDRCRLLTVTGMGGIGKTSLVVRTAEQITCQFEHLVWYSLRNAPSIEDTLLNLIQILSNQQENELPETLDGKLSRLIHYLNSSRCLIVLDNLESILQSGDHGSYRQGYQGYGQLLRAITETNHQSCVVITSREMPIGLSCRENTTLVRLLKLTGLPLDDAQTIFKTKGIFVAENEAQLLCQRYQGNPLALKIVATTIHNLFAGQVENFLVQEVTIFGDIREILAQQFQRLSEIETQIMYWLAINQEPYTIEQLQADIIPLTSISIVIEALESLDRRSLIEISPTGFSQQSVVMEYVKDLLIEQIYLEITTGDLQLFNRYALIKASAKNYIREIQIRVILEPIINKLTARYSTTEIENQLKHILSILKEKAATSDSGYGGGNLLNLLRQLGINLTGYDFSHLSIWQAYLQDVNLHQVNLAYTDIKNCVLAATFGGITCVTFSPNSQFLATSDTNGDLQIWSTVKGKQLSTYKGHNNWVWCVAYSSDNQLLASAGQDHTVKLWNTSTHQQLNCLQGHTSIVTSVSFSPDNTTVISSSMDKTIKLWDVETEKCTLSLSGHNASVWSVVISPDGQIAASGAEDRTIKTWDIQTGVCLQTFLGHTDWVKSVSFSPDSKTLATSSFDHTIKLWHVSTGKCLKTLLGHTDAVVSVCFSPDGQTIATGSYDRTIKLWHVSTGKCLKTLQGHTSRVWSVAFSPNGHNLASGGDDHAAIIWDIDTGNAISKFQGHSNCTYALALSPNRQILASAHEDQTIKLWHVNAQPSKPITYDYKYHKALYGHNNRIFAVVFSPDGSILASSSGDRTIKLWDTETWRCINTFRGHNSWVWSLAFSPDGKTLASGSYDRTIKLWHIETGNCIHTLAEHPSSLLSVAFSPDGTILASSGYEQIIKLWDVVTGICLKTWEAHSSRVWCVAFSPDGKTLATAGDDQTVKLWNIDTDECLHTLKGHSSQVISIRFDYNDLIISGSGDNTIKIWDAKTGKCLNTLEGHKHFIWTIDVLKELQIIVSGSQDNTIKFWDIKTGECLKTLAVPRPYEESNIVGVTGLTESQKTSLKLLGAVETKELCRVWE